MQNGTKGALNRSKEIHRTLICPIPKVCKPDCFQQFRPISLCNVAYKAITKVIVNRIRSILPKLIHPSQTTFVAGGIIIDNTIIAQDIVHTMRTKKGKKGWLVVKLDLEKACD